MKIIATRRASLKPLGHTALSCDEFMATPSIDLHERLPFYYSRTTPPAIVMSQRSDSEPVCDLPVVRNIEDCEVGILARFN